MLAGITEHSIGQNYAAAIRAVGYEADQDKNRDTRIAALEAFERAGNDDYRRLLTGSRSIERR